MPQNVWKTATILTQQTLNMNIEGRAQTTNKGAANTELSLQRPMRNCFSLCFGTSNNSHSIGASSCLPVEGLILLASAACNVGLFFFSKSNSTDVNVDWDSSQFSEKTSGFGHMDNGNRTCRFVPYSLESHGTQSRREHQDAQWRDHKWWKE